MDSFLLSRFTRILPSASLKPAGILTGLFSSPMFSSLLHLLAATTIHIAVQVRLKILSSFYNKRVIYLRLQRTTQLFRYVWNFNAVSITRGLYTWDPKGFGGWLFEGVNRRKCHFFLWNPNFIPQSPSNRQLLYFECCCTFVWCINSTDVVFYSTVYPSVHFQFVRNLRGEGGSILHPFWIVT